MTEERVFRKYKGKSGKTWIVGVGTEDGKNNIYVSADPRENEPGYRGSRGFDGGTINFGMEDGSVISLKGPWHSSLELFTKDTGVKL